MTLLLLIAVLLFDVLRIALQLWSVVCVIAVTLHLLGLVTIPRL